MTSIHAVSPPGGSGDSGKASAGGAVVDMGFAVFVVSMVMLGFQRDDVEFAMADAALGHQRIGELPDIGCRAFEDHTFQTVVVVEMAVHGSYRQVGVVVLEASQALGQFARVVGVDV